MKRLLAVIILTLSVTIIVMAEIPWPEKNIWPESPQARTIRHAMMPASSILTGAVQFTVPLYEVSVEGFSIPFSLEYRTNGIRPDDDPQPIGYGWTLSPPLRVSRAIMSLPDEYFDYVGDRGEDFIDENYVNGYRCVHIPDWLPKGYNASVYDTQRDIFTVYLLNKTLTMVYVDGTLKGIDCDEYKVECGPRLSFIKVTDPSGVVYDFSLDGESVDQQAMRTEWMLTSITLPSGSEITFEWDEWDHFDRRVKTAGPKIIYYNESEYRFEVDNGAYGDLHKYIFTKNLSSVTFPGGKLTCKYDSSETSKMLSEICVSAIDKTVMKAVLRHSGLLLSDVEISGIGKYSFEYNPTQFQGSTSVDWWGYHNGKKNGSRLYPTVIMNWNVGGNFLGADRSVDVEQMKANILTKTTLPTGGILEWEYEPHRFPVQHPPIWEKDFVKNGFSLSEGGGLRVKQITMKKSISDNTPRIRKYIYGDNGDGLAKIEAVPFLHTFISETDLKVYRFIYNGMGVIDDRCMVINRTSNYLDGQHGVVPIWYSTVSEIEEEGKREYKFEKLCDENMVDAYWGYSMLSQLKTAFSSGPKLMSVSTYRSDGDSYSLVEKEENKYTLKTVHSMGSLIGMNVYRKAIFIQSPEYMPDFGLVKSISVAPLTLAGPTVTTPKGHDLIRDDTKWFASLDLLVFPVTEQLTGKDLTTLHDNGSVTVSKSFSYVEGTSLVSAEITTCGDETKVETTGYTDIFDAGVASQMSSGNIWFPVEQSVSFGSANFGYSLEMKKFGSIFRPYHIWQRRGSDKWSNADYAFDTKGNLLKMESCSGVVQSWTWDSYGNPITQCIGTYLKESATWSHLVGVTSKTDASGVRYDFSYDSDGRLSTVSLNSRLIERYEYRIGQDGNNYVKRISITNPGEETSRAEYYDGLGRIRSEVVQTPEGGYVSSLLEYDAMGRCVREWGKAPVGNSPGVTDKVIQVSATSFYGEKCPYVLREYETSPREVEKSVTGMGDEWHSVNKNKTIERHTNDMSGYVCAKYCVTTNGVELKGNWKSGTLFVEKAVDEEGTSVETYTDFRGNVVCRKENGKATYYVYDDFGDLRYILPPGVSGTRLRTDPVMNDAAFWYDYDMRGRMILKKIPGAKVARMVYDPADRLVGEQSSNHRSGEWRLYGYDSYGRKVLAVDCLFGDGMAQTFASQCRTVSLETGGRWAGYSLSGLPLASKVVYAKYYDDYTFITVNSLSEDFNWSGNVSDISYAPAGRLSKGLLTGVFTGSGYESYYYNGDGLLIERYATGFNRGRMYMSYTYSGNKSKKEWEVDKDDSDDDGDMDTVHPGTDSQSEEKVMRSISWQYDKTGKMTEMRIYPEGENEKPQVTTYEYDAVGRLEAINAGPLKRSFKYNSRGWLTSSSTVLATENISERILYGFNGNVLEKTFGNGSYQYRYDSHNRLISATCSTSAYDFSTEYEYDERSNIISLQRKGIIDKVGDAESFGVLDDLKMEYDGNRLSNIKAFTEALGFNGMTGLAINDDDLKLTYDESGRLVSDMSRDIVSIEYDNDGHPLIVVFGSGSQLTYLWDGMGNHLRTSYIRKMPNGRTLPPIVTEYTGDGRVYEMDSEKYARFPGGYLSGKKYYWYISDNQNNIVGVGDSSGNLVQSVDYYPYGEPWREPEGQPFLYSGKERVRTGGINEYDFDARMYNSVIGSYTVPDPLSEKTPWISPYAFCNGNPVTNIDDTGLFTTREEAMEASKVYNHAAIYKDIRREEWYITLNETGTDKYSTGGTLTKFYGPLDPSYAYKLKGFQTVGSALGAGWSLQELLIEEAAKNSLKISGNSSVKGDRAVVKVFGKDVGKYFKTMGKAIGIINLANIGITTANLVMYINDGGRDWWIIGKGVLDIGMTAAGYLGPAGYAVSTLYFLTDTYLWYRDTENTEGTVCGATSVDSSPASTNISAGFK